MSIRVARSVAVGLTMPRKVTTSSAERVACVRYFLRGLFKDVRAQNFPHTDFVKTLTAGRE